MTGRSIHQENYLATILKMVSVSFHAEMPNISWFQMLKYEDLLFFPF